MAKFRPLRKENNEKGSDSGGEAGGTARAESDNGDFAESGVPLTGSQYQYNVQTYDPYEQEDSDQRPESQRGQEATRNNSVGAAAKKKKKCMLITALVSSVLVLGGLAVGGYFLYCMIRPEPNEDLTPNPNGLAPPSQDLALVCGLSSLETGLAKCLSVCEPGKCCFGANAAISNVTDCYQQNQDVCKQYQPCEAAFISEFRIQPDNTTSKTKVCATLLAPSKRHLQTSSSNLVKCHPDRQACETDADCSQAVGNDATLYGSCMMECSNESPTTMYCSGEITVPGDANRERKRTICHPNKKECTSDADCVGMSVQLDMVFSTERCKSECELTIADKVSESAVFSTVLSFEDIDTCELNSDQKGSFCQGVVQGAGDISGTEMSVAVPVCEVISQACSTGTESTRLLRSNHRILQSPQNIALDYQLTWNSDAPLPAGTFAKNYLEVAGSDSYLEDLKTFLDESGLSVSTISTPSLVKGGEVQGGEVKVGETDTNSSDSTAGTGYCGSVDQDSGSVVCSDQECAGESDCADGSSCISVCLLNDNPHVPSYLNSTETNSTVIDQNITDPNKGENQSFCGFYPKMKRGQYWVRNRYLETPMVPTFHVKENSPFNMTDEEIETPVLTSYNMTNGTGSNTTHNNSTWSNTTYSNTTIVTPPIIPPAPIPGFEEPLMCFVEMPCVSDDDCALSLDGEPLSCLLACANDTVIIDNNTTQTNITETNTTHTNITDTNTTHIDTKGVFTTTSSGFCGFIEGNAYICDETQLTCSSDSECSWLNVDSVVYTCLPSCEGEVIVITTNTTEGNSTATNTTKGNSTNTNSTEVGEPGLTDLRCGEISTSMDASAIQTTSGEFVICTAQVCTSDAYCKLATESITAVCVAECGSGTRI